MTHIGFATLKKGQPPVSIPGTFSLAPDNWDDFGFKTLFTLYFAREAEIEKVGMVKIAQRGTEEDGPHTDLPSRFTKLSDDFFSLGQDRDYYEKLNKLPITDQDRVSILSSLRDIAYDESIYATIRNEPAFTSSLLRGIPELTIATQLRRIAHGGVALTPYRFSYQQKNESGSILNLDFTVEPESTPPTNVHVLIGANGVGKSTILRYISESASGSATRERTLTYDSNTPFIPHDITSFVNIVTVAYSAFDYQTEPAEPLREIPLHQVGLYKGGTVNNLTDQFINSLKTIDGSKSARWKSAIKTLSESDSILGDLGLEHLVSDEPSRPINLREAKEIFKSMSSGHKIATLTATRLVEFVEERSLVLLDEPETHLHPPLLSALIRSISDLMIDRNGVAIIATHSPVVLQEVPRSCVWDIRRSGDDIKSSRLETESFGESVSKLTAEVFRLDIRKSSYHSILRKLMSERGGATQKVLSDLSHQLGSEGLFSLYAFEEENDV